ncbi:unnamed protein product [Staurois parvus]|uniref:Uncharacterized protein n=1 Tax=Staurois parvus TaxID=386267 RepID=A0ABN9B772_9NEOB|nr:unnamed protein product [Staurois parvus]
MTAGCFSSPSCWLSAAAERAMQGIDSSNSPPAAPITLAAPLCPPPPPMLLPSSPFHWQLQAPNRILQDGEWEKGLINMSHLPAPSFPEWTQ